MPDVLYGERLITYSVLERPALKAHYISVDRARGVVLKGRALPEEQAARLIKQKARWILDKLALVSEKPREVIVTGSRITYLGRSYYCEVIPVPGLPQAQVTFNHSRFRIQVDPNILGVQAAIREAVAAFMQVRASEKLTPRVVQWARKTGLRYEDLRFRQMDKRWGSCTPNDVLVLNPEAIRLPYSLIDYLIVHELCHTKVKSHAPAFWAEVARHLPNWRELDAQIHNIGL